MLPLHPVLLVIISLLQHTVYATRVETFSDDNCKISLNNWRGPNGYPSGRCTSTLREGKFTSFKIVDPYPGCAITIHAKDTTQDICSGFSKVGEPSVCFNATWHYYSIDECFRPGASSLTSSASSPTSTEARSRTQSNLSGGSHKSGSGGKSSSTSTSTAKTTTSTADSSSSSDGPNIGAIAGGAVGGVVFGLAFAGLVIWFFVRSRRAKRERPPPAYSSTDQPLEVAAKEMRPPGPPPQELSQHSIMELQGNVA